MPLQPETEPPAGHPDVEPPGPSAEEDPAQKWQAFLSYVQKKEGGPLFGKLSRCRLSGITDHCLKVTTGRSWHLAGSKQEARLKELVRAFFGPQYSLKLEHPEPGERRETPAAHPKALDLPTLKQQALEIFGGRWLAPTPEKEEPK